MKSSDPDARLEALPVIGVQPQPIGGMRSKGIRHRPMLFDGIEPPTRKTAPPLTDESNFQVCYGAIPAFGNLKQ